MSRNLLKSKIDFGILFYTHFGSSTWFLFYLSTRCLAILKFSTVSSSSLTNSWIVNNVIFWKLLMQFLGNEAGKVFFIVKTWWLCRDFKSECSNFFKDFDSFLRTALIDTGFTYKSQLFSNASSLSFSIIRSSHPEVFLEKGVLKICSKFTGEHPCRSAISVNLQSNFIEIALRHGCSAVNLQHIFRKPFLKNTSGRLLLNNTDYFVSYHALIVIIAKPANALPFDKSIKKLVFLEPSLLPLPVQKNWNLLTFFSTPLPWMI